MFRPIHPGQAQKPESKRSRMKRTEILVARRRAGVSQIIFADVRPLDAELDTACWPERVNPARPRRSAIGRVELTGGFVSAYAANRTTLRQGGLCVLIVCRAHSTFITRM